MNNTLYVPANSELDNTLFRLFSTDFKNTWEAFIKTVDENIIDSELDIGFDSTYEGITITFKDEISKTFFLLKYS